MNRFALSAFAIAVVALPPALFPTSSHAADELKSPIFGVGIPEGYRQWELVGVAHESGLDELRAIVGNPVALKAYRDGVLPFPDGTVLAKLAWKHVQSTEFEPAFVPGAATTVQIMVKDSVRYADTGGWGFGRFIDGTPVDEAQHQTCFGCHAAGVKDHDRVFTRLVR
ncbi:MAG: cytochrome P460 family protein [Beijerinckiaceae bacterium]|nr:cytochrome P460 family protein [Beijerinckiaceae bacterium]